MRARRRVALSVAGAAALVAAGPLASPAQGEALPQGGLGGAVVNRDGDPTAIAASPGGRGGGPEGGGGGSDLECRSWVTVEDDFKFAVWETEGVRQHSQTGRWISTFCENGVVNQTLPEGGLVDPVALAEQAMQSVEVPDPAIGTSPPSGSLYVQVPTWLWVDAGWWAPYEATATAGRVSSTVTAQPVSATWVTGDGATVTCAGPGQAWSPGADEAVTDCSHTYTQASAGVAAGSYTLGVTVQFEVGWSSNTGQSGTLQAITRTASQAVQVGEVQAVETG